jgi:glycosyltransferase involved in cell wall biosynthesis
VPRELRVCRAIFSYPTSEHAGAGLPAYFLSQALPHRTLHLARRLPGVPRPIGAHVELRLLRCPNPPVSGKRTPWARARLAALKALGVCAFVAQALPAMLRFRPHVVHVHTHLPLPLAIAGRLLRRRVLITVHGTDLLAVKGSRLLRWAYAWSADEICYVSQAMEPELRAMFPRSALTLTPSGVDLSTFHPAAAEALPQIVAVGTLKWQKGYPVLIDAFARVAREFPGHRLVIVGGGEGREELGRAVAAAGLEGRVVFAGPRNQEEIAATLRESELFVLASISEGFPKVVLEALACGLPVVVTDVGSCGQVVRAHGVGVVVPPGDAGALAAGLRRMLSDPAFRAECAGRAHAAAGQYGWPAVASIVDARYRALTGGGVSPSGQGAGMDAARLAPNQR